MTGLICTAAVLIGGQPPARAQQTVGLFKNEAASFEGYTLFAPRDSLNTYLIDNHGKLIHSWSSAYNPGFTAYLLENGHLLRAAKYAATQPGPFQDGGGAGGRVEEFTWDGTLVWDFVYSDPQHRNHHDIERLPNGNVLMVAWEYKSAAECIDAGRDPLLLTDNELWPDHVIEVQPTGPSGGTIVWEWHVWDHLIQGVDPTKANFGVVADHSELINLNFDATPGAAAKWKADWTHINGIDYNPTFDQILLSSHGLSEIWVIDHSTTTEEAAGHTGGNSGMGGDLIYRWGNPQAYDRGLAADQTLFRQHDARWVEAGHPGAGNITIFNNGVGRPGGDFSSVDEIVPPVDQNGNYTLEPGAAYGPSAATWTYAANPPSAFFARRTSGAHRLPNGNTLICQGPNGRFFEVTPAGDIVWEYVNPVNGSGPVTQGMDPGANAAFRATRLAPDDAGLAGRDLTPGDPLELFTRPVPVPDGEAATTPLRATRLTTTGDSIRAEWDTLSCAADGHNLIYGDLADVSSYTIQGGECGLGISGSHDWIGVPAGDLFFVIVGTDDTGIYESSWGVDGSGGERNGDAPSYQCGVTTKDATLICP